MPKDTRDALSLVKPTNFTSIQSRSLILDRFANPEFKEDKRKEFFNHAFKAADRESRGSLREARLGFVKTVTARAESIAMDLVLGNRLILNASGGVMENAGLCLDRFSNLPYIPGSALKGCARRAAIHALAEFACGGNAPTVEEIAKRLADIALVFGWSDLEWTLEGKDSDFRWASGRNWPDIRTATRRLLWSTLGCEGEFSEKSWANQANAFAGGACFLDAYPTKSPDPDLELDVVTCHHPDYYKGAKQKPFAYDDEDPNPVYFPAVAKNHTFRFAIVRSSRVPARTELIEKAAAWLREGLTSFGIGGKTAAGYGWFDDPKSAKEEQSQPSRRDPLTSPGPIANRATSQDALITKLTTLFGNSGNFGVALPELANIKDDAELNRIFHQVIPERELRKLKAGKFANDPYWSSFKSKPDGTSILKRLKYIK